MKLLLSFLAGINFLMIISLVVGYFWVFKEKRAPKLRALYAVYLVSLLFFYLLSLMLGIFGFAYKEVFKHLPILIVFLILPFIIGKFANYKKLGFYTFLQIFAFIISLVYITYLLL